MNTVPITFEAPQLSLPNANSILPAEKAVMLKAGAEINECLRVLKKAELNLVGEVLRDQGDFIELEHYPKNDIFDSETHSQYYYHAHRTHTEEHGHFHTFLRAGGMPSDATPLIYPLASEPWPQGVNAIGHLVGISMDAWGQPVGLFATNRWVTNEAWYPADEMIRMLPRFAIDHAWPSWPVNRWITAMLCLFRPHIESLLIHRDEVIRTWQSTHPEQDVFEDCNLELTGYLPISVNEWLKKLEVQTS